MILQKDNVRNQRENVVLTIANAQCRLGIPVEADPVSASWSNLLSSFYICEWNIFFNANLYS